MEANVNDEAENFLSNILGGEFQEEREKEELKGDDTMAQREGPRRRQHHDPGLPNQSVILHGINYSTIPETLSASLHETGAKIESCKIILDKDTGKSRGFAFVKFYSVRFATEWVDGVLADGGFQVDGIFLRIEFCKDRDENVERLDWHCFDCAGKNFEKRTACFRCGMDRGLSDEKTREAECADKFNEGQRDIGSVAFHTLLFRGLDPLTTEDAIWQNTLLWCKPKSIWLVKDRKTRRSLGHCFVDFSSIEMANKLLNKMFKGKEPKPFYIENRIVEVSYAHMGSFIPFPKPSPFACLYEPSYEGAPKMFLSYWDSEAYCRPYPDSQVDPEIPPLPTLEDYLATLAAEAAVLVDADEKKGIKEVGKRVKVSLSQQQQMSRWNNAKKEIGDLDELMENTDDTTSVPDSLLAKKISSVSALNDEFSDLARIACLLPGCRRKFESIPALTRHQKESLFHAQQMRIYRRTLVSQLRTALQNGGKGVFKQRSAALVGYKGEKERVTEQPTRHGIQSDNKGNVMLAKMGWKAGQGLGREGEGIVKPIKLEANNSKKGLGMQMHLMPRSLVNAVKRK